MAKQQSMKSIIYQQIANQQVQQVLGQQQAEQLQADFNAWNKQQQDIAALQADFDSWYKSQQPAQPAAPVQQATVNEVKSKKQQEIPSLKQTPDLTNWFKPVTASGRDVNAEAAQKQKLDAEWRAKQKREDYYRQQQAEAAASSYNPEKEQAQLEKDIANVSNYVEYDTPQLTKEQKALEEQMLNADKYIPEVPESSYVPSQVVLDQMSEKPQQTEIKEEDIPEELISRLMKDNNISRDEAIAMVKEKGKQQPQNQAIAPLDESKIDLDATAYAQAVTAEKNRQNAQKQQTAYESFLNNMASAVVGPVTGPVYLAGKLTGNDWDLVGDARRQEVKNAAEQHRVASGLGTMAGMALGAYALGGGMGGRALASEGSASAAEAFKAAQGEGLLNGLSQEEALKLGLSEGGRQLFRNAGADILRTDLATDIIPTLANDIAEGKSTGEVITNTALNTGLNFGFNAIGDIASLYKAVKNTSSPSILPKVLDHADDVARTAPTDSIDDFTKNSLDNVNTSAYDEGVKNVDSNLRGNENGTVNGTGNKGSFGPEESVGGRPEISGSLESTGINPAENGGTSDLRNVISDDLRQEMNEAGINDFGLKDTSNNPQGFSEQLAKAKEANPNGRMVSNQSVEDLAGAKIFTDDANTCGVAVLSDGDIVGVHKNPSNKTKGAVDDMLITARENGGTKLDCYGSGLVSKYEKDGFIPVAKVEWNEKFRPDDWGDNPPEVVYIMMRDNRSTEQVLEDIKNGTFKLSTPEELENLPTFSIAEYGDEAYSEALKYRDSLLDMNLQFFAEEQPKQGAFFNGKNVPEVKERGQSVHLRGEGAMQMEGVADEVAADFKDNPDMYKVLKNEDTLAKAQRIYSESDDPETAFRTLLDQKDPAAIPLGHQIAKDYSAAGNHEAAAQIYRDMGEKLTEAGQFTQAAAINMMKDDPMTALMYAERQIDALNEAGRKRFGSSWVDFKLTDDEIKAFSNIAPGDTEAIKNLFDNIGVRIGKDYPTTLMDKLLEGRKVAMLFNLRTNVRNTLANPPTLGLRWVSDRFDALGQQVAHLIDPEFEVTQSLTGSGIPFLGRKQNRQLATEAWNSDAVQAMVKNTAGKYEIPELSSIVGNNKQVFKGTRLEKWIDDVTGGGIQKVNEKLFGKKGVQSGLETIRNATYKMLDLGDSPFVRENFIERLSSYINAKGIKDIADIPDEAIQMAWEEAMKATYKDNSWAVQMLSGLKQGMERLPGVGRALSQAAIPFVQAPGNIAARMIDYSPIKAGKGIIDIISAARKGDAKAVAQGINEAAKGLTGTGLVILGMKLREAGILTGSYSEDKDQRAFEKQNGFKEFALHVGDQYFTYDWAQPFAESLIIGTLLQDAIMKSDEYNSDLLSYIDSKAGTNLADSYMNKLLGTTTASAKASVNSWFEESPLQGLQELLSGGYTGGDIAGNLANVGISNFASAFIPSSLNAVAKTLDPVQRNTNDKSNSVSKFVQEQQAKLPGLSDELPAKYDTWGREMKYADNPAMAFASRFLIPGDYSYDKSDAVDNEINRLYEEATDSEGNLLKDIGVFPQVAPDSVGGRKLNNEEVSAYQQDMGQRNHELVETFINSDAYNSLSDTDKINAIEDFYKVSKAITERDLFGKEVSQNKAAVEAYDSAGGGEAGAKALVEYYTQKAVSDSAGVRSDSSAAKAIQADVQAGNMEAAQEKVDAATQLQSLGLDKPGPIATYYKAVETFPSLTPEEFAKTFNAIDKDHNQGLKKAEEVIPYMNSQNMSYSEGMKFWNAYANEKWKIPKLEDGTWK